MIYDYVIVGGGMAGLYSVQLLHEKHKGASILIVDDRCYWGGRVLTNENPFYEIGAARFNDNHPLLLSLLKQYKCHKIPIKSESLFLHDSENGVIPYYDSHKTLETIMKNIESKSKKYSKSKIQQYSLKAWIDFLSNDKELSSKIKDIFGYDTEINVMNAYDALKSFNRDFISNQFYIIQEGYSELCQRMYKKYSSKKNIYFSNNTFIKDIYQSNESSYYDVIRDNDEIYKAKHVICAVKAEHLRQFSVMKPIVKHISCVYSAPLLRIYAKYPLHKGKAWFDGIPKITTNAIIRQIIPIHPSSGLIMISYTDGDDIKPFWRDKQKKILKTDSMIQNMISKCLKRLFPLIQIPDPTYFKTHLWTIGCHHWKPKCDSLKIGKEVQNPCKNIYVIGEAFSQKQAWVEGALETTKQVVTKIII